MLPLAVEVLVGIVNWGGCQLIPTRERESRKNAKQAKIERGFASPASLARARVGARGVGGCWVNLLAEGFSSLPARVDDSAYSSRELE